MSDSKLKILQAEARHAEERVRLYRQRLYAGRPLDHIKLVELERLQAYALRRLRQAQAGENTESESS